MHFRIWDFSFVNATFKYSKGKKSENIKSVPVEIQKTDYLFIVTSKFKITINKYSKKKNELKIINLHARHKEKDKNFERGI